ncbi:MAG TPA: hypothetical protein VEK73_12755 [Xanthobacteraceae bacterium]|nr:hypothetical protein [Xanthobacteraceae bacterium]
MCFGMTTTNQQTTTPSGVIQGAGQQNLAFAQSLAGNPFSAPLQGTAGFTPMQNQAFGAISSLANAPNANNPFYNTIANQYAQVGATPAPQVGLPSVLGANVNPATASLSQYIDPNLQMEVAPTLQAIQNQAQIAMTGAGGVGSNATAAGAFGDARHGVQNAQTDYNAMLAAGQATGQAYQNAFQNAANLRGVDLSNLMNTQTTNAALQQQQLQNMLGSGNALTNLAQYTTGTGLNLAQASLAGGTQQQQLAQQQMNALYNQQLQNLLGPYQYQLPGLNQTLQAAYQSQPVTTTTQQPNNALWNLAGTTLGSLATGVGKGLAS